MAPFPEEVDVFTAPHSRMKELVEVYSVKLHCTDFSNNEALESLLNSLDQTFCEFKTHEQIENKFIMKKLKNKLKALHIQDSAVCNCHNDSQLSDMLALVKDGYSCTKKSHIEKVNYGLKLQHAMEDFTKEFLPHMQEEEEVFQPMLMKYFNYDELRSLKELVLKEHIKWRNQLQTLEKHSQETKEKIDKKEKEIDHVSKLPAETLNYIFSFLNPREKIVCSEVSKSWNEAAYDQSLWTDILPIRWAQGIWDKKEPLLRHLPCKRHSPLHVHDEDADLDESEMVDEDSDEGCNIPGCKFRDYQSERKVLSGLVQHVLPRVGSGVKHLDLGNSSALSNEMLRTMLVLCPNIRWIDVSDTHIGDQAFKGLSEVNACHHIEHMDLACSNLTDHGLQLLGKCLSTGEPNKCSSVCSSQKPSIWKINDDNEDWLHPQLNCRDCPLKNDGSCLWVKRITKPILKYFSLSGCYKFTDYGLSALSDLGLFTKLEYLDLSGCYQLSASCLTAAINTAHHLQPSDLYYCNEIQEGPYEEEANGCQNLEGQERFCCRSNKC